MSELLDPRLRRDNEKVFIPTFFEAIFFHKAKKSAVSLIVREQRLGPAGSLVLRKRQSNNCGRHRPASRRHRPAFDQRD